MAGTGDSCSTWWEVDLEESLPINKVLIVNPKCSGDDESSCSCKLSFATISLLNAQDETVSAKVVGNTCNKGWVVRKFEIECPPTASPTTTSAPTVTSSPTYSPIPDQVDVVIIGAGSAGLSAAARLEEFAENVTYVVLEAQGRVGGRAQSRVLDFGNFQGGYTIEEGANWITNFTDNPILELAQKYDIKMTLQNWWDIAAFQGGVPIANETMNATYNEFYDAWDCLQNYTWAPYEDESGGEDIDIGAIDVLSLCGWNVSSDPQDNIKHFMQWYYIDFEYAQNNSSLASFPTFTSDNVTTMPSQYFVQDQDGGLQRLFEGFMNDQVNTANVFLNTEVVLVDYSESVSTENPGYNAQVHLAGRVGPILCKRVISTLSVGILEEKKDTLFSPAIETDLLSLKMMQYIKVFYQFQNKFWGDEEFVLALKNDPSKRGHCDLFQNMATPGYTTEDSNILFCTLITESYLDLIEDDGTLSESTLDSFLQPLALIFANYEEPIDRHYFAWNNNEYSGHGSYSNWEVQPNKTWTENVESYFNFFGGWGSYYHNVPDGWYNATNGYQGDEWVLHLSGTASCFEHWELLEGAYYSGLRSANYILHDFDLIDLNSTESPCEDF